MSLDGKVSLITGGAQGLGRAFAEALLKKGARVCLCDVNEAVGNEAVQDLNHKYGEGSVAFIKCNVTSQEDMERAFAFTKKTFGGLDIVCNNAGISDEKLWDAVIQINLIGVVRGTMLAIDHMSKEKGGKGGIIINTGSIAGLITYHHSPAYNAAKFGVVAFTRSWAKNPACEKMGLRFHAICPAFAQTAILASDDKTKIYDADGATKLLEEFGTMSPETVADAFMQLVQSEGSSGEVLAVSESHGVTWVKEVSQI